MFRMILSLVGLALLFGAIGAPASATKTANFCADAEERAVLAKINQYRAGKGRKALALTQTLGAAADHHSVQMAKADYFSHTLLGGVSWDKNIRNHGYTFNTARGENIAAGHADADTTFLQWKGSPEHNKNMLDPDYKAIGIGRAYDAGSRYGWYWTTVFGGVVDAAARTC